MKEKIALGFFAIIVIGAVLFLTLQGPEETTMLSKTVHEWAERLGYKGNSYQFRSDVHLIEYFIVGIVMILLSKSMGWKTLTGIIVACIVGILDETIKVFLPTREFGFVDLIKDFIGIGAATLIVILTSMVTKKRKDVKMKRNI